MRANSRVKFLFARTAQLARSPVAHARAGVSQRAPTQRLRTFHTTHSVAIASSVCVQLKLAFLLSPSPSPPPSPLSPRIASPFSHSLPRHARQQCTNARFLSLPRLTPRDVVTRFFASTWSGERASPSLLFPLPPRCRDALTPSSLGRSSIARCTKGAMARRQHRIGVADRCHARPSPAAISTSLAAATVFATPPASPASTPPALLVLATLAVLNRQRRDGRLGLAKVAWVRLGLGLRVEEVLE